MELTRDQLRVVWEAVTQYCDNAAEAVEAIEEAGPANQHEEGLLADYATAMEMRG